MNDAKVNRKLPLLAAKLKTLYDVKYFGSWWWRWFYEVCTWHFSPNLSLNVTGSSASAVAHVCMKVVTSWLILHCATCYM